MTFTTEIAMALGYKDRCEGVDAEERRITLWRFRHARDRERLEDAYWRGWREADCYIDTMCRWARGDRKAA
jgi:hypothetical protein